MKRLMAFVSILALVGAASAQEPFSLPPDWISEDMARTLCIVLGDFNGDGWVSETAESSTGDGHSKVFHLDHFPARDVAEVRVDGRVLGLDEYCEDPYTGWIALGEAPADGAIVEVDYTWSDRLDLFAGNDTTLTVPANDVVYYNEGNGLSEAPGWTSELNEQTNSCAAGDLDLDGDLDLVCGGEGFLRVYYNDGNGLEDTPSWSHLYYHSPVYINLDLGDYNDDGYPDLAVADFWADCFVVYTNEGGVLTDDPLIVDLDDASSVEWGDYDADGDLDLAVASLWSEGSFTWVYENVNGVIQTTAVWRNDPPRGRCYAVAWGDANEDGYLDLYKGICGAYSGLDHFGDIFYGDGSGLPTSPSWESQDYDYVNSCRFGDVSMDGHVDMVQACGTHISLYFWDGDGLGTEPSSLHSTLMYYTWTGELGDLNNDGAPDLALGVHDFPVGKYNLVFYNQTGVGLEDADIFACVRDEGVLVGWTITGDIPMSLRVLRSVDDSEPVEVTGALPGAAVRWLDTKAEAGGEYRYWLEVTESDGTVKRFGPTEPVSLPEQTTRLALGEPYPSPARDEITLTYDLPNGCSGAVIEVYDLSGRRIDSLPLAPQPGRSEIFLDVSDYASGVYTARLSTDEGSVSRRLVISR